MMRNAKLGSASGLVLSFLLLTQPVAGQLPGASPATLGTANNYTALARGFAAVGLNPAGLGMPETKGFTLAILPVGFLQSLDPLSFSDIFDYEGVIIPSGIKEDWLQQIGAAGRQTGLGRADLTAFSLSYGHLGVQLSSIAGGRTDLNQDAAELLFFGNGGRTGDPADLALEGSGLTGWAFTTLGISYGFPLNRRWVPGLEQGMSIGVTVKQTWGHGVAYAEDAGTFSRGDPIIVNTNFPMIYPNTETGNWNRGSGIGLDIGMAWERGPWAAAATVQNVIHSFEWDIADLSYRPNRAVFDGNENNSDFEEDQAGEAPTALLEKIRDLKFRPVVVVAGAYDVKENLSLTAEVRQRTGDGLETEPKSHLGLGMVFSPDPRVPLRAGFAAITDGFQVGGGFGVILGPAHIGFGALFQTGDVGDGFAGTFGLSFGGG